MNLTKIISILYTIVAIVIGVIIFEKNMIILDIVGAVLISLGVLSTVSLFLSDDNEKT